MGHAGILQAAPWGPGNAHDTDNGEPEEESWILRIFVSGLDRFCAYRRVIGVRAWFEVTPLA